MIIRTKGNKEKKKRLQESPIYMPQLDTRLHHLVIYVCYKCVSDRSLITGREATKRDGERGKVRFYLYKKGREQKQVKPC